MDDESQFGYVLHNLETGLDIAADSEANALARPDPSEMATTGRTGESARTAQARRGWWRLVVVR
jgi:hypothetical protein